MIILSNNHLFPFLNLDFMMLFVGLWKKISTVITPNAKNEKTNRGTDALMFQKRRVLYREVNTASNGNQYLL